jgi:hypothetical protein
METECQCGPEGKRITQKTLQARLLAYVRAKHATIPPGAAIRITSKESGQEGGATCRVWADSAGRADPASTSTLPDPGSSAPSTSKISYPRAGEGRQPEGEPEKKNLTDTAGTKEESDAGDRTEGRQSVLQDTFEDFKDDSNSTHVSPPGRHLLIPQPFPRSSCLSLRRSRRRSTALTRCTDPSRSPR